MKNYIIILFALFIFCKPISKTNKISIQKDQILIDSTVINYLVSYPFVEFLKSQKMNESDIKKNGTFVYFEKKSFSVETSDGAISEIYLYINPYDQGSGLSVENRFKINKRTKYKIDFLGIPINKKTKIGELKEKFEDKLIYKNGYYYLKEDFFTALFYCYLDNTIIYIQVVFL